jgi:hypothetical protein
MLYVVKITIAARPRRHIPLEDKRVRSFSRGGGDWRCSGGGGRFEGGWWWWWRRRLILREVVEGGGKKKIKPIRLVFERQMQVVGGAYPPLSKTSTRARFRGWWIPRWWWWW